MGKRVRYAVVGLGHIAQVAVLPAFAHAAKNSEVTALVSGDPVKLKQVGAKYKIPRIYSYRDYDRCLTDGGIDAVYIAVPNSLHCDYARRAAQAGIHVLCEKPMAVTERECRAMIQAAKRADVKLMIAYRLHFEEANMRAVEMAQSGKLGRLRFFNSVFTMQVREGDIRVQRKFGGGTLYDIGVYCINAARYVFRADPVEVSAYTVGGTDRRFREVDEMASVMLRFPDDRLSAFVCSFGATDVSSYEVVGTKGRIRLEPAYEYIGELKHEVTVGGKTRSRVFLGGDQFASELLYFSNCVLTGKNPEPSGLEGMIDVRIVEALYRSAKLGRPVKITGSGQDAWPDPKQIIRRPPVKKPALVRVKSPSL
ncbi:MAG TPA: Gfo/Idh/MocA family oxidoreductase [Nitrospiraceae bacterium]|nr:Gfo/Idh/MocA family oxidoreductase [Nitrospiraceae bacterium]